MFLIDLCLNCMRIFHFKREKIRGKSVGIMGTVFPRKHFARTTVEMLPYQLFTSKYFAKTRGFCNTKVLPVPHELLITVNKDVFKSVSKSKVVLKLVLNCFTIRGLDLIFFSGNRACSELGKIFDLFQSLFGIRNLINTTLVSVLLLL